MKLSVRTNVAVLGLALFVLAPPTRADDTALVGRVYPAEPVNAKPAFTVQFATRTTGDTRILTERYEDMDGKTASLLESTYVAGALRSIVFEQSQSKESASAVFKDGRVFFTTRDHGDTAKSDQAVKGDWVPLSAAPEEIVRHWDGLAGGKPIEFVIPVPVMRDHFSFEVTRQRSWTEGGKRLTEFRMQPSSRLIRMIADAFYYVFDDESRTLIEYRGVTTVKASDNGKLKDLKARIVYGSSAKAGTASR